MSSEFKEFTLYTHPYASFRYCSSVYISYGACKENLFNNQELLEFLMISLILMNLMFDLGVLLLGEIQCLSL